MKKPPYQTLVLFGAMIMVVLFIYQNGNLNLGISTLTPPSFFTVAIIGLAIANMLMSNYLIKFALLVLVVVSIYPIQNLLEGFGY